MGDSEEGSSSSSQTLCIGDVVLLYAAYGDTLGYVFSKVSSSVNEALGVFPAKSIEKPNLPNVHYATFTVLSANSCDAQNRREAKKVKFNGRELSEEEMDKLEEAKNRKTKPVIHGEHIQLRHTFTGKYIAASGCDVSQTDRTSLEIKLQKESNPCCLFKIRTFSRTQSSLGEEVTFGEEVRLEKVHMDHFNLHYSEEKFESRNTVYSECQEINLVAGNGRCCFKIIPHQKASKEESSSQKPLQAGNPVVLYGLEDDVYVRTNQSPPTKVQCKKVHINVARVRSELTSATGFWQFEKADNQTYGGPISAEDACFIKHVPSQSYLSYDEASKSVKLFPDSQWWNSTDNIESKGEERKDSEEEEETPLRTFKIVPLSSDQGKTILMSSMFFRIKPVSKGLNKYVSVESTGKEYELSLSDDGSYFLLDEVNKRYQSCLWFVSGLLPLLFECTNESASEECQRTAMKDATKALNELESKIIDEETLHLLKAMQKYLKNEQLQVIDDLCKIVVKGQAGDHDIHSPLFGIQRACYKVILAFLKGESHKNYEYLLGISEKSGGQLFTRLWEEIDKESELCGYAVRIISQITQFIDWISCYSLLKPGSDSPEHLANTAIDMVNSKPVQILKLLGSLCCCAGTPFRAVQNSVLTKLVLTQGWFFVSTEDDAGTVKFQTESVALSMTEIAESQEYCDLLCEQLKLFQSICKGDNRSSDVDKMKRKVRVQHLLKCIMESEPPTDDNSKKIMAQFLDYIKVLFVETGESMKAPTVFPLPFMFHDEPVDDHSPAASNELKTWVLQFLKNTHWINEESMNILCLAAINLLFAFVEYGYFFEVSKAKDLVKGLLSFCKEEEVTASLKQRGFDVLLLLWKVHFHRVSSKACSVLREDYPAVKWKDLSGTPDTNHKLKEVLLTLKQVLFSLKQMLIRENWPFPIAEGDNTFEKVLPDLADDVPPKGSIQLLELIGRTEVLLLQRASREHRSSCVAEDTLYREVKKALPNLKNMFAVITDNSQSLTEILSEIDEKCEGHSYCGTVLIITGVMDELVKFLLESATGIIQCFSPSVLEACFNLLTTAARETPRVKRRLFGVLNKFLLLALDIATRDAQSTDIFKPVKAMAVMIKEIFAGEPELCFEVQEEHIKNILVILCEIKDSECRKELLCVLEAIAKVNKLNLPMKKNQICIITHFLEHADKFCKNELSEEHTAMRFSVLSERTAGDEDADTDSIDKNVLLGVTSLLSSCADGRLDHIETVCQNIFQFDELLTIISAENISSLSKLPFLRLFVSVYVDTTASVSSDSIEFKRISTEVWDILSADFSEKLERVNQGRIDRGLVSYISQGVFPFLRVYYKRYFFHVKDVLVENIVETLQSKKDSQRVCELLSSFQVEVSEDLKTLIKRDKIEEVKTLLKDYDRRLQISCDLCNGLQGLLDRNPKEFLSCEIRLCRIAVKTIVTHKDVCDKLSKEKHPQLGPMLDVSGLPRLTLEHSAEEKEGWTYAVCEERDGSGLKHYFDLRTEEGRNNFEKVIGFLSVDITRRFFKGFKTYFHMESECHDRIQLHIQCLQTLRLSLIKCRMVLKHDQKGKEKKEGEKIFEKVSKILIKSNITEQVIIFLTCPEEELKKESLLLLKGILEFGDDELLAKVLNPLLAPDSLMDSFTFITQGSVEQAAISYRASYAAIQELQSQYEEENDVIELCKKCQSLKPPSQMTQQQVPAQATAAVPPSQSPHVALTLTGTGSDVGKAPLLGASESAEGFPLLPQPPASGSPQTQLNGIGSEEVYSGTVREGGWNVDWIWNILRAPCSDYIKLPLEVMRLLCRNQNHTMQTYFCVRPNHISPINVVGEITLFLKELHDGRHFHFEEARSTLNFLEEGANKERAVNQWELEYSELIRLIFHTLSRLCVGNHANKMMITQRNIAVPLNLAFLLQSKVMRIEDNIRIEDNMRIEKRLNLMSSAVELLYMMIENTDPNAVVIAQGLFDAFKCEWLTADGDYSFKHSIVEFSSYVKEKDFRDVIARRSLSSELMARRSLCQRSMARVYHILLVFEEYDVFSKEYNFFSMPTAAEIREEIAELQEDDEAKPKKAELNKELDFAAKVVDPIREQTHSVEVLCENPKDGKPRLTRVYFSYTSKDKIGDDIKEQVQYELDRTSAQDRLRDLLSWNKDVKKYIQCNADIEDTNFQRFLRNTPFIRSPAIFLLTLLINIFLVIAYSIRISNHSADPPITASNFTASSAEAVLGIYFIYIFGSLHFGLLAIAVLHYYFKNWPFLVEFQWYSMAIRQCLRAYWRLHVLFLFKIPKFEDIKFEQKERIQKYGVWGVILTLFATFSFLGFLFTILTHASVLDLQLNLLFYSLCLLLFVDVFKVPFQFLKSLLAWKTAKSIGLVSLLGIIILFIYSVSAFLFLFDDFAGDAESGFCSTLGECFVSLLRFAVLNENLGFISVSGFRAFGLRFIFDFIFYVVWVLIGLNIILGLIVDSFNTLHTKQDDIVANQQGFCSICGNESYKFDKISEGFKKHTQDEHNMWNYMYYSRYLDKTAKDKVMLSAVEKNVADKIERDSIDFFPLECSIALKQFPDDKK